MGIFSALFGTKKVSVSKPARAKDLPTLIAEAAAQNDEPKLLALLTIGAMFEAVSCGDIPMLKRQIEKGVDVNYVHPSGLTALVVAVVERQTAAAKWLAQAGADVSKKVKGKNTAIEFAMATDQPES